MSILLAFIKTFLSLDRLNYPFQVVQNLLSCLDNPELPFLQWQECFAVLANRLPKDLRYEVVLTQKLISNKY